MPWKVKARLGPQAAAPISRLRLTYGRHREKHQKEASGRYESTAGTRGKVASEPGSCFRQDAPRSVRRASYGNRFFWIRFFSSSCASRFLSSLS